VREVSITTFVSFIKEVDVFDLLVDSVIFRGQPVKGNLLPSIARKAPAIDTTSEEKKILKQLKLQGASMLPSYGATDLDLLVLAQHYGLKTRLLDECPAIRVISLARTEAVIKEATETISTINPRLHQRSARSCPRAAG
jgi:hypothetical protein